MKRIAFLVITSVSVLLAQKTSVPVSGSYGLPANQLNAAPYIQVVTAASVASTNCLIAGLDEIFTSDTHRKLICTVAGSPGTWVDFAVWSAITGAPTFLQAANNLSDLTNAATARTNLGLGTAATQASSVFFQVANNLSEGTASTMRTNLGLGSFAVLANPATTNGDTIYFNGTAYVRLANPGSSGTFCETFTTGGVPSGWTTCPGAGGGLTSVGLTMPAWFTVTNSPLTVNGTIAVTAASAQTSHQVIGTCGTATSFAPCSLVLGDLPAIPWSSIANPTTAQSLSMNANQTLWTWGAATGAGTNMFQIVDTINNTGTGYGLSINLASGSAASPFRAAVNGNGVGVNNAGVLGKLGTGSVSADAINGTTFGGTNGNLVAFGASNTPTDSGLAKSRVWLTGASTTANKFQLVQTAGPPATLTDGNIQQDATHGQVSTLTEFGTAPSAACSFSAGTATCDASATNTFTLTLSANVSTLTINNLPTTGVSEYGFIFTQPSGGGFTVACPGSFQFCPVVNPAGGISTTWIMKYDAAAAQFGLKAISDTGPSGVELGNNPIMVLRTVDTGGVTANQCVKTTSNSDSNGLKVTLATTGCYGIAMTTVAAAGYVWVARYGVVSVNVDNATTAGDLAIIGTSTASRPKDSGQTSRLNLCNNIRVLGLFETSQATPGSSALLHLSPADYGQQICNLPTSAHGISSDSNGKATTQTLNDIGAIIFGTGGGTANAQTVTSSVSSYTTGAIVEWIPSAGNTGATTLTVGTGSTVSLTKCGTTALASGDLTTTMLATAQYDGTRFQLINPQATACGGASGAVSSVTGDGAMFNNSASTGAVTLTLSNAAAHKFWGNPNNGATTPGYTLLGAHDVSPASYAVGGGTANAQTLTLNPAPTALVAGLTIRWLPLNANTGATTMTLSGLAATTVAKCGTTALANGDLTTTAVAEAVYDGSIFQLINPQAATCGGGGASSISYWSAGSDIAAPGGAFTNTTGLWSVYINNSVTFGTITADFSTASTDTCDVGIYDSGGTLKAHWGATTIGSGVTFQAHTIAGGGTVTITAGWYEVGFTCTSTSQLYVSSALNNTQFSGGSSPTSGNATTGGALNSSVGVPTATYSNVYRVPTIFLRQ